MRLLSWRDGPKAPEPGRRRAATLFGLGLVGAPINAALCAVTGAETRRFGYDWNDPEARTAARASLDKALQGGAEAASGVAGGDAAGADGPPPRLDVVWSAGRSGFASDAATMEQETALFAEILEFLAALALRPGGPRIAVHLVSSAGGLFEGRTHCDGTETPAPLRPYGVGKLEQETRLAALSPLLEAHVYRPSSVYGFRPGARLGLAAALARNTLANRVTRIVGLPATLRDYVLAEDVGGFVAARVAAAEPPGPPLLTVSGRPSATCEVIDLVGRALQRPPLLQYDPAPSNARPMSFLPSARPAGWRTTPLEAGIYMTVQRVRAAAG